MSLIAPSLVYRGRLAPSPTGYLHLGHAATFLRAADRAAAARGELLLRLDDLDGQRSRGEYITAAKEDLHWLGLSWNTELRQSERLPLYRAAVAKLLHGGLVYPCTCSRRDLQQAVEAPHEDADDEPVYNGRCRPTSGNGVTDSSEVRTGKEAEATAHLEPGVNYRFRVPDGETIRFFDGNCGPQVFTAGADFGDFLVWRRDGLPSYQLASVVDDADAQITEVVRGRDLLRSTARQLVLQRALALPEPGFWHTELLLDEQGRRLAKRNAALSLRTLRAQGVTPAEIRARVEAYLHHTFL